MSKSGIESRELLREGRRLHQAGQLDAAQEIYLQALKSDPDNPECLHWLANIDSKAGRFEDAERSIRRALEIDSNGTGFHNTLGNILFARGDRAGAEESYRAELLRRPDFAVAHNQLGQLLQARGDIDGALQSFRSALKFAPGFAQASDNLGRLFHNQGRLDEAVQAFAHAIAIDAEFAAAYGNMGHVLRRLGRQDEARQALEHAVRLAPGQARAQRNLGELLIEQGDVPAGIAALRQAIKADPRDYGAVFNLGVVLQLHGVMDEAANCFRRALELKPGSADAYCNLGACLLPQGEVDAAEAAYAAALANSPGHAAALTGMAGVLTVAGRSAEAVKLLAGVTAEAEPELVLARASALQGQGDIRAALALVQQVLAHGDPETASSEPLVGLRFKAGELLDKSGDHDAAFAHLVAANRAKRVRFDRASHAQFVNRTIATWSAASRIGLAHSTISDATPVFVLGMPRSGTSLVEQILASHPDVHGAGELELIGRFAAALQSANGAHYPESALTAEPAQLDEFAGDYLRRLHERAPDARYVVDKSWRNFEFLGFISQLFPRAKIIYCRRDPLDTGLSCFQQNFFGTVGVPFSYDLADIGYYLGSCERLMKHWQDSFGVAMHTLAYETLVTDLESEVRALLEFLELPWEPACLEFHRTERVVATASFAAVRQPLYTTAVGRHRHYTTQLEPLRIALEQSRL